MYSVPSVDLIIIVKEISWESAYNKFVLKNNNLDKGKAKWIVTDGIICMLIGCVAIYSALFSTGYFIYGETTNALSFLLITILFSILLFKKSKNLL